MLCNVFFTVFVAVLHYCNLDNVCIAFLTTKIFKHTALEKYWISWSMRCTGNEISFEFHLASFILTEMPTIFHLSWTSVFLHNFNVTYLSLIMKYSTIDITVIRLCYQNVTYHSPIMKYSTSDIGVSHVMFLMCDLSVTYHEV